MELCTPGVVYMMYLHWIWWYYCHMICDNKFWIWDIRGTSHSNFLLIVSFTDPALLSSFSWQLDRYIQSLVSNALASDPEKSLHSRKSWFMSGWTMTSIVYALMCHWALQNEQKRLYLTETEINYHNLRDFSTKTLHILIAWDKRRGCNLQILDWWKIGRGMLADTSSLEDACNGVSFVPHKICNNLTVSSPLYNSWFSNMSTCPPFHLPCFWGKLPHSKCYY